jgi:hypothetical protein
MEFINNSGYKTEVVDEKTPQNKIVETGLSIVKAANLAELRRDS